LKLLGAARQRVQRVRPPVCRPVRGAYEWTKGTLIAVAASRLMTVR
jgi:hypothetical protein